MMIAFNDIFGDDVFWKYCIVWLLLYFRIQ
jgi:hypothetical protein